MKAITTYHLNKPDTINGNSISITTTYYGTEEEVDYIKKSCDETIGSALLQEYGSPFTSQGHIKKSEVRWTDKVSLKDNGDIIDFNGSVIGHINFDEKEGDTE